MSKTGNTLFMLYSEKQHELIDFMKNNGFNVTVFGAPQAYISKVSKRDTNPAHKNSYDRLFYVEDYIKNNLEEAKKEYAEEENRVENEKRKSRYKETKDDNIQPNSNNSDVIIKHKKSKPTQKSKIEKLREEHKCFCKFCGLKKRRRHVCNCKYCLIKNNHTLDETEDNSENETDNDTEDNPDDNSGNKTEDNSGNKTEDNSGNKTEDNSEDNSKNETVNDTVDKSENDHDNKIINNSVIKSYNKIINYMFICMFIISLILNINTRTNLLF